MKQQTVIALGFFDGVHLAHGALLKTAVRRAQERGCLSAAFTFDRSPREVVTGERVALLTTPEERQERICGAYGVDRVIAAPFDDALRTLPWETFLTRELVERCGAVHLVAGHDYRFGYRGEGTPERLRDYCAAHGLGCDLIERIERGGVTVSSSHIRALLAAGDVAGAAEFLGYPYTLSGTVQHGQGLGHRALVPTLNLLPDTRKLIPARGVYATLVRLADGREFPAVTNIGVRPSVCDAGGVTVETYLPGFSGDLYGAEVGVRFFDRLREERKFDSLEALRAQIEADVQQAERILRAPQE